MANQIQSCFRRYEKKYRLTAAQQRFLLEGMAPYMKKAAYGAYTICNIYYDTEDWRLIRTSLEKPVYKEKLRVRSYGVPSGGDRVFVELKKKYDGASPCPPRRRRPFWTARCRNGNLNIVCGRELTKDVL